MAHSLHAHSDEGLSKVFIVTLAIVVIAILAAAISLIQGSLSFLTPQ